MYTILNSKNVKIIINKLTLQADPNLTSYQYFFKCRVSKTKGAPQCSGFSPIVLEMWGGPSVVGEKGRTSKFDRLSQD